MKRILLLAIAAMVCLAAAACSNTGGANGEFDASKTINMVSREAGSGTRGAFVELFGIETKGQNGTKKDMTSKEAVVTKQTDVMLTTISTDIYSIGYVSLGSLNDAVKAVAIDGVQPTAQTVKDGTYSIKRPFNIATKGQKDGLAKDFIDFILSKEGQEVVSASYIAVQDSAPAFAGTKPAGKITIVGSSSVTPIMEKLKEAYLAINTGAEIEIQQSDSSSGIMAAMEGTCDIAMSSRDLKEEEKELTSTQIAIDGIAVIVNTNNTIENMKKEQVNKIYTGQATIWNEIDE